MKEYVIWGVPPEGTKETILLENLDSKPITYLPSASRAKEALESMGCTEVRIQTIDLADNDLGFVKAIKV